MSDCPIMKRMKINYEQRNEYYLTRRTPVLIRIDGKAFHTYTRNFIKPYDVDLISTMEQTALYLCENISGAKCAYTFSDEISILVTDYDNLGTQAWFDYSINKIVSVSASLATFKFNQLMYNTVQMPALFDSRSFNIPQHDVNNYFVARQKDCIKNSISQLAQSLFSTTSLDGKNSEQRIQMCIDEYNADWNKLADNIKYGSFIKRVKISEESEKYMIVRNGFKIVDSYIFKDDPSTILDMVAYD